MEGYKGFEKGLKCLNKQRTKTEEEKDKKGAIK